MVAGRTVRLDIRWYNVLASSSTRAAVQRQDMYFMWHPFLSRKSPENREDMPGLVMEMSRCLYIGVMRYILGRRKPPQGATKVGHAQLKRTKNKQQTGKGNWGFPCHL